MYLLIRSVISLLFVTLARLNCLSKVCSSIIIGEPNLAYICSRCYRAPELIFGSTDYNQQIDVWSTGCILVEMINGEPPFLGDSQIDQLI